MDFDSGVLRKKLAEWLGWERRKRREQTMAAMVFYALLLALATHPLYGLLSPSVFRWFAPVLFFAALAPLFFIRYRWRSRDSVRALARLDKTLSLDERALTSWELLERKDREGAALLVLKEAQQKIDLFNPKALSRRTWNWHAYAAAPLFCLWLAIAWFDFEWRFDRGLPAAPTIAYELRQFSRQLQEKAKAEGLRESLQWGRELETLAQKNIEAKTDGERLKRELAGVAKKIEAAGKAADAGEQSFAAAQSEQDLQDLKAEMEATRDFLNSEQARSAGDSAQQWFDRFAGLPQLKQQLDRHGEPGRSLGQDELKAYLDQVENQVARELDRRALLDAQRFLEQLVKKEREDTTESETQLAGRGEQPSGDEAEKTKSHGSLPGDEPGSSVEVPQFSQQYDHDAQTRLKGLLTEGARSSLIFKGKPLSGKSEVSEDEVMASYQRQVEADLNREQVPEGLRELIKNYFLALGMEEGQP